MRQIRAFCLVLSWSGFCHRAYDRFHGNGHKLCIFCFRKLPNSKFATKTTKSVNFSFFAKKLPKRLIFYRVYNMHEEEEYSPSEFYYPEDLETSNVETELRGIGVSPHVRFAPTQCRSEFHFLQFFP